MEAMGYPGHRVARALRSRGNDQDGVFDFLCWCQKLCDKGHPEALVFAALDASPNSESEVEHFVSLLSGFTDMGFSVHEVQRALQAVQRSSSSSSSGAAGGGGGAPLHRHHGDRGGAGGGGSPPSPADPSRVLEELVLSSCHGVGGGGVGPS